MTVRPPASNQWPAASGQQPAASNQRPAASDQQPAASDQRPASSGRTTRAFTMIEVLGSVLVLSLAFASAIGMVLYGFHLSKLSMGRATALATAMTVAVDPTPLQGASPSWTVLVPGTTKGYLNSYYVERTEGAASTLATGITVADVAVDVYETARGRLIASYNQRLVKKSP